MKLTDHNPATAVASRITCFAVLGLLLALSGCRHLPGHHKHSSDPAPRPIRVSGHVRNPITIPESDDPVTLSESIGRAGGIESPLAVPAPRARFGDVVRALDRVIRDLEELDKIAAGYHLNEDEDLLSAAEERLREGRRAAQEAIDDLPAGTESRPILIRLIDRDYVDTLEQITELYDTITPEQSAATSESIRSFIKALTTRRSELNQTDNLRSSLLTPAQPRIDMLVCLSRDGIRRYYDASLALRAEASHVQLQPGDEVTVLRYDETPLANPRPRSQGAVRLAGWAEGQGFVDLNLIRRVSQIETSPNLRADVPTSRLRIQVTRKSLGETGKSVFVLPFEQRKEEPLRSLELHPGDEIAVVPDLQAPLVMDQLIGSIVASNFTKRLAEVQQQQQPGLPSIEDLEQRLSDKRQRHRERVSRIKAALTDAFPSPLGP